MRVPFGWLKDYVDLEGLTAETVAERLTAVGVAVEHVETRNRLGVSGVVVGHILTLEPHPNADRLRVGKVDTGARAGVLQIVTGAPNVKAGDLVPVALDGARVAKKGEDGAPALFPIKTSKLRGLESQGMMCSADELDIDGRDLPAEQREGVLIFPPGTEPGADVLDLLALNDPVLVMEPFANRPDFLSILGIAREAAAALQRPLKELAVDFAETDPPAAERVRVGIADTTLCPRYTARVIEGVRVGPTPLWMAGRLQAAGMRSVSNVVDITNYVMLETGQPLHAFDHAKVRGGAIEVRPARDGERMVSIDGVERVLDPRMLIIADADRPVAIAGVMGGLDSEVSDATTTVLLESATFHAASVRRTSNRLALRSESSRRFEKGLDWHNADLGSRRAAWWMAKLCGGVAARGVVEAGTEAPAPIRVRVRPARVNHVLGSDVPAERMREILSGLHFHVADAGGAFDVTVPSYRLDVRREEDLVEEVARHYGYDNIPDTLPRAGAQAGRGSATDDAEERIRDVLVGLGVSEAITLSLLHPSSYERLRWPSSGDLTVKNPLVGDQSQLRTTLLPHLVAAAAHNLRSRSDRAVRLFELSKIYRREAGDVPVEHRRLGMVMAGAAAVADPYSGSRTLGFFHLKGVLEAFLDHVGLTAEWGPAADAPATFHPGKVAEIRAGGRALGMAGALHPEVMETLGLDGEMLAAELDSDVILEHLQARHVAYAPIARLPEVERDLALVVKDEVRSGQVRRVLAEAGGALLRRVACFDVYHGEQIPPGHKSLAFSMAFQSAERTLTDAEIDDCMQAMAAAAHTSVGAVVRR